MRGGGAAGDEGLEHARHHHRLHVLCHRLVVPGGEVVPEARLVWKRQRRVGESTDHTGRIGGGGGVSQRGERTLLTADQLEYKPLSPYNREGRGERGGQRKRVHKAYEEKQTEKGSRTGGRDTCK